MSVAASARCGHLLVSQVQPTSRAPSTGGTRKPVPTSSPTSARGRASVTVATSTYSMPRSSWASPGSSGRQQLGARVGRRRQHHLLRDDRQPRGSSGAIPAGSTRRRAVTGAPVRTRSAPTAATTASTSLLRPPRSETSGGAGGAGGFRGRRAATAQREHERPAGPGQPDDVGHGAARAEPVDRARRARPRAAAGRCVRRPRRPGAAAATSATVGSADSVVRGSTKSSPARTTPAGDSRRERTSGSTRSGMPNAPPCGMRRSRPRDQMNAPPGRGATTSSARPSLETSSARSGPRLRNASGPVSTGNPATVRVETLPPSRPSASSTTTSRPCSTASQYAVASPEMPPPTTAT